MAYGIPELDFHMIRQLQADGLEHHLICVVRDALIPTLGAHIHQLVCRSAVESRHPFFDKIDESAERVSLDLASAAKCAGVRTAMPLDVGTKIIIIETKAAHPVVHDLIARGGEAFWIHPAHRS